MKIFLAHPRGFCGGVKGAISILEDALRKWKAPIYVKHQIVHNRRVVQDFESRGVVFIEDLSLVPPNSVLIYSAHGVGPLVRKAAKDLNLHIIDATCPLVTKLHQTVIDYSKKRYHILLIGNKNHAETKGVWQEAPDSITVIERSQDCESLIFSQDQKLIYLCQTTWSLKESDQIAQILKEKFPQIQSLPTSSICLSTTKRQKALSELAKFCDLVLVIGDVASSNSCRLQECAQCEGAKPISSTAQKKLTLNGSRGS